MMKEKTRHVVKKVKNNVIICSKSNMERTTKNRKPSRPYTDYNIFFQLEREYILQVDLGVKQKHYPGVFDPSNSDDYHGPPLPSRYCDLALPDDWHIPGKVVRRKRIHRKSHGVIGFRDLSNRIAKAWKSVDGETKDFCAKLSDIGMLQYKTEIRQYKLSNPGEKIQVTKAKAKAKAQPKTSKPKSEKPTISAPSEDKGDSICNGGIKRDAAVDQLKGRNDDIPLSAAGDSDSDHQCGVIGDRVSRSPPYFRPTNPEEGSLLQNAKTEKGPVTKAQAKAQPKPKHKSNSTKNKAGAEKRPITCTSAPAQFPGSINKHVLKKDTPAGKIEDENDDLFTSIMVDGTRQDSAFDGEMGRFLPHFSPLKRTTRRGVGVKCVDMEDNEILGIWDDVKCVDMEDNEILGIWDSLPKHEPSTTCRSPPDDINSTSGVPMLCVPIKTEETHHREAHTPERHLRCQAVGRNIRKKNFYFPSR